MRRLANVTIEGLLGRFNHSIDFPEDWEFVILHGPNGVGKTRFLEVIQNAFLFRPHVLADQPFQAVSFSFTDGTVLEVKKLRQASLPLDTQDAGNSQSGTPILQYVLRGVENVPVHWNLLQQPSERLSPARLREIERYLPIEQMGSDLWLDQRSGEYMSGREVLDRFTDELPYDLGEREKAPEALRNFLKSLDVHLIETQRLVTFDPASDAPPRPGRRTAQRATVIRFAEDLTSQIRGTLARNSRTAQELDRTFPRRILLQSTPSNVSDDQIRIRYEEQSHLRRRLAEIAVLDSSAEMTLPDRALQDWERGVLWTYLEDSEKKLSTFQTLLDRVQLLREVVNSRFLFKELRIDADRGFRFVTDSGDELLPHQLSSGEQHELVLLYDLLFTVQPNSLVLVDEPEISLHIAWQQQFLNDIQRIAVIADLQFVIATHSPQIIHDWWDRAVALYTDPARPPFQT